MTAAADGRGEVLLALARETLAEALGAAGSCGVVAQPTATPRASTTIPSCLPVKILFIKFTPLVVESLKISCIPMVWPPTLPPVSGRCQARRRTDPLSGFKRQGRYRAEKIPPRGAASLLGHCLGRLACADRRVARLRSAAPGIAKTPIIEQLLCRVEQLIRFLELRLGTLLRTGRTRRFNGLPRLAHFLHRGGRTSGQQQRDNQSSRLLQPSVTEATGKRGLQLVCEHKRNDLRNYFDTLASRDLRVKKALYCGTSITHNSSRAGPELAVMRHVTIFHNPRCSKSRETLQLLRARGLQPDIVEYLDSPPTPEQLSTILDQLGLQPRELMRSNESEYRELGLDDPALTRQQLIQAMANHPRLIQRPIVLSEGRAALGRPPQSVLEIV